MRSIKQPPSSNTQTPRSVLIISGQSGSGKSTAIRTLEDHGFFCVDNMPSTLVEQLIDTVFAEAPATRLALVMDIREKRFLAPAPALIERLRRSTCKVHLLFLEAHNDVVLRRYSETRRLHPLDAGKGLHAALSAEQHLLAPLRALADSILDTSHMSPHALRQRLALQWGNTAPTLLHLRLLSFGFKYGIPLDADSVLDVRFLPNPYFVPAMRPQSGEDREVAGFVLKQPEAQSFLVLAGQMLHFLLPHYQKEGKRYFTLAIGCTGGRHRSVAIAAELCKRLGAYKPQLSHRDVQRTTEQEKA